MRIQNKHEYKNYLGNQRIAYIQKGNRRLHTLIQFVNNDLVDKLVIESNKEVSGSHDDNLHVYRSNVRHGLRFYR